MRSVTAVNAIRNVGNHVRRRRRLASVARVQSRRRRKQRARSREAPQSPTESYSHIWLNDLSLTADDVDSVRFYCTSSGHSRVVHFETSNIWAKSALVTGTATGNKLSYWTSGTTKFSDHTGVTPDLSNFAYDSLIEYPFFKASENHWAIRGDGSRWECDDAPYQTGAHDRFTTVHQIWFKKKQ